MEYLTYTGITAERAQELMPWAAVIATDGNKITGFKNEKDYNLLLKAGLPLIKCKRSKVCL